MMEADKDNNVQQESVPSPVVCGDFVAEVNGVQIRGPDLGPGKVAAGRRPEGGYGVGWRGGQSKGCCLTSTNLEVENYCVELLS
jgi:hypothetical protein